MMAFVKGPSVPQSPVWKEEERMLPGEGRKAAEGLPRSAFQKIQERHRSGQVPAPHLPRLLPQTSRPEGVWSSWAEGIDRASQGGHKEAGGRWGEGEGQGQGPKVGSRVWEGRSLKSEA